MKEFIQNEVTEKQKLTMIELFSGIGAQKEGTDLTGVFDCEVVATADIEKDAMVSYAAIHDGLTNEMIDSYENYPSDEQMRNELIEKNIGFDFKKMTNPIARMKGRNLKKYYLAMVMSKNLGDISKITELPLADFWTYSFPCFVEGTLVLTNNGYKPIEEIVAGEYVLTHTNSYKKVVKPMINQAEHIYKLDSMVSESLFATKNHPFYVRKKHNLQDSKTGKRHREFETPIWKPIGELSTEYYVGTAINTESKLPTWDGVTFKWSDGRSDRTSDMLTEKFKDNDFWYLIGRYIGDGWIRSGGGIIICANDEEVGQVIERIENLGLTYNISKERTANKIHLSFKEIGEYCEQFGRGASNKHLTSDILNLPVDKLKSFLEGYIGADGCFTQNKFKITSVSRNLIYEVGQCIAKVYHIPFSVYFTQRPKTTVIEGRVVNQKDTYQITFSNEKKPQAQAFYEDGYIWSPIRNITEQTYDGLVYNLEVEEDNSYVVQNIIVHNCQDISVAGKQAGIVQGETRSGLLYEVERLLVKAKESDTLPKYLLLENVKNLVGKQFKEQFDDWITRLDELGFNTYWSVVNAKDCGIAQNRERVFAVSIRKDVDTKQFEFMKPFDLGLRLRDFLDDEVDEKYYLSQEIQDRLQIADPTFEKSIIGTTKLEFRTIGQRDLVYQKDGTMGTLVATDYKQPKQILEDNENRCIQAGTLSGGKWDKIYESARRYYSEDGVAPTIHTCGGGNTEPKVEKTEHSKWRDEMFSNFVNDSNGEMSGVYTNQSKSFGYRPPMKGYSKTLKANANDAGVVCKKRVRKLTPRECYRLMGFSDECYDKAFSVGLSDSAGYKQAGNSIVTYCIKGIMEHLYKAQYDNTYVCFDENFTKPQAD